MLANQKIEMGIAALLKILNTPHDLRLSEEEKKYLQPLQDFKLQINKHSKQAVIFGAFKAGKSTLINAWLGSSWLPSRSNRATGVPTHINYHRVPAAWVNYYSDGKLQNKQVISPEQIGQYILLNTSQGGSEAPEGIQSVELGLPLPLLKKQWSLIDTPGLLDNAALSEVTFKQLKEADLAIVVLLASKLLSEAEREAIQRVNTLLKGNLVVVINQIDQVDLEDRASVVEWATSFLTGVGNQLVGYPAIFTTSAKGWLKQDQPEMLESRIAFRRHMNMIFHYLLGNRVALLSRLSILEYHLQEANAFFQARFLSIQKEIQQLEVDAEENFQLRKTAFEELLEQINLELELNQLQLSTTLEQMNIDCSREAETQIGNNNPQWLTSIRSKIIEAANSYSNEVEQKFIYTLKKLNINLPSFSTDVLSICEQANIDEDFATGMAKTFGSSTVLGLSRWVAKVVSIDLSQNNLEAAKLLLQMCISKLREETKQYIEELDKAIDRYQVTNQPKLEISETLKNAYQYNLNCQKIIIWLDSCKSKTQVITEEIMDLNSQFDDLWEEFAKLVDSSFQNQRIQNIKKPQDLNYLANQAIKDVSKRWQDTNSYNYAWLEKLSREHKKISQELIDLIQSVKINQKLEKYQYLGWIEISVLVITVVLSSAIAFWGQDLQNFNNFRLSFGQFIQIAGVLCGGCYLVKAVMDYRYQKFEQYLKSAIHNNLSFYKSQAINILNKIDD
ncbi:MAG TPA: dynamin family protein [Oculatellaceae cyanobacterium]|jgi:GTP-binding protein EngB required for normal cell division